MYVYTLFNAHLSVEGLINDNPDEDEGEGESGEGSSESGEEEDEEAEGEGKGDVKRRERGSEEVSVPAMCGGQFMIVHQLMTSWMKTILN